MLIEVKPDIEKLKFSLTFSTALKLNPNLPYENFYVQGPEPAGEDRETDTPQVSLYQ